MKKNVGNSDRIIRVLFAIAVSILYFTNVIGGIAATISLVLAGVFVLTGLVGFCPIYALVGINTCPGKVKQ